MVGSPQSAPPAVEEGSLGNASSSSFSRQARPWFILLLLLSVVFLAIRWRMGDAHGALLMFAVCAVGVLALTVGTGTVDPVYSGYFGLMAFVSGLLDLNLAIEQILWSEWKQWHHQALLKGDLSGVAKPAMYLACSALQLASAFVAYLLYKECEGFEDFDTEESLLANADQARIYNAVLSHGAATLRPTASDPMKAAFAGHSHKLP
uniref:Uncharacterized protein n=1 Tax=Strombidinopsis acuminata TaxID=141414 RepID=A0A7S3SRD2_9SPIT|mmetsp:Transcript_1031/g.2637  ORF Transcript_1031/g.2637 Transcript_1031/m.2637 type:complete len:206 (+) Transcript_1031:143-760(+)